jgi:hypothetical protein
MNYIKRYASVCVIPRIIEMMMGITIVYVNGARPRMPYGRKVK